ncbi:hypothetical protein LCGC14_1622010 [marine sediment metagenome]|uniref:Uncharacterized protein n=1 Tax=marine sediment metagenome TaxID=412755 RepID=A0A0F9I5F0_9ZZZZ
MPDTERLQRLAHREVDCPECGGAGVRVDASADLTAMNRLHDGVFTCTACEGSGKVLVFPEMVRVECKGHWVVVEDHRQSQYLPEAWQIAKLAPGTHLSPSMTSIPANVEAIQKHGDWCCSGLGTTPSNKPDIWMEAAASLGTPLLIRRDLAGWDVWYQDMEDIKGHDANLLAAVLIAIENVLERMSNERG